MKLHQFVHSVKPQGESITEIGLVLGSHLTHRYFGIALALRLYPTLVCVRYHHESKMKCE